MGPSHQNHYLYVRPTVADQHRFLNYNLYGNMMLNMAGAHDDDEVSEG